MITLLIALFLLLYIGNGMLHLWLSHLDICHMNCHRDEIPGPFRGYITPERYAQSIRYTTVYHHFSTVAMLVDMALFLVFIYTGFLDALDGELRRLCSHEIHRGSLFFFVLYMASHIVGIPFSLYATFVIEERFGFNRQTFALWLKDELRSALISLAILVPISYVVLYFMHSAGYWWWLYVWLSVFAVALTLAKLYPVLIAPLLNKFTPLPEGPLRTALQELVARATFPLANIYVMDASIRTSHPNAYFAGFGKTKRLVLFDSLAKDFTENEIAAVVAHEIGHDKHKHVWKSLLLSQTISLLFFYCLNLMLGSQYLYQVFLVSHYPATYMGLVLLSIVSSVVLTYVSPLFNLLSWRFESEADRYAATLVTDKQAIKSMLLKLMEKSLANLTPHPLYARFHYSHPPVLQRLQNLAIDK
jgi:STE24 endopeptidase